MTIEEYQTVDLFLGTLHGSAIFGIQGLPPSHKLSDKEKRLMAHYGHLRDLKQTAMIDKPDNYLLGD